MIATDISPAFQESTAAERTIVNQLLIREGTPRAIQYFIDNHHKLGDYHYWFLLSTLWVKGSEGADLGMWRILFSADRPNKHISLMKPSELIMFRKLTPRVMVFRAHRPDESDWFSYTLNHRIAIKFAAEYGVDVVQSYWLDTSGATALFTRRGEAEILVLDKSAATPHKPINLKFTL